MTSYILNDQTIQFLLLLASSLWQVASSGSPQSVPWLLKQYQPLEIAGPFLLLSYLCFMKYHLLNITNTNMLRLSACICRMSCSCLHKDLMSPGVFTCGFILRSFLKLRSTCCSQPTTERSFTGLSGSAWRVCKALVIQRYACSLPC